MTSPMPGSVRDATPSLATRPAPGQTPGRMPRGSADPPSIGDSCRLDALRKGQRAVVTGLDEADVVTPLPPGELERRMIEMGLIEGARVEILHEGFPGADPLAVRIDNHTLALRRAEAHAVLVTLG